MKIFLACLISAFVAACSPGTSTDTPTVAAQKAVYRLKSNYDAALAIAIAYKQLPPCGLPASPVLCAQPKVIAQLQQADYAAYPAFQAAENTVRSQGAGPNADTAIFAAQQAIAALTSITATLNVK